MIDENPFPRRVNDDPVKAPTGLTPQPVILTGRQVRLEPLDLERHIGALYRIGHESETARQSWAYLPWGPFSDEAAYLELMQKLSRIEGNAFFAICDAVSGAVVGMAAYWDSQPVFGVTEIAAVWFAPAFQRTPGATEAMFLMLAYAMDELTVGTGMRSFREAADRLPASAMLTTTDINSMRSISAVFPNLEKLLSDYAGYTSTPQLSR